MKLRSNSGRPWKLFSALVAACSLSVPAWGGELPSTSSSNLSIINGSATTTSASGNTLTINTNGGNNVVLSWENFWDGTANGGTSAPGAVINYILPSATSSILNNVTGGVATTINGELTSNGKIFLINPAGITVSGTGVVNAAGFYASTFAEPISYFETNGTLAIYGNGLNGGSGSILLQPGAQITTIGGGGNVQLAAPSIDVSTTIVGNLGLYAEGGAVTLGANGAATVAATQTGSGTVGGNLSVYNNTTGSTISLDQAAGNNVTVQGNAAVSTTVPTAVTLDASTGALTVAGNLSVASDGGNIVTNAGTGTVTVTGSATLDASGTTSNGNISQTGSGIFSVANSGTTTLLNTATESTAGSATTGNPGGSTAPGTITLGNADFASVSVIGGATSITDSTTHTLGIAGVNGITSFSASAAAINQAGAATENGTFSLTSTGTGTLTLGSATVNGNYTATSGGNIATANSGAVAVTGTGHTIALTSTGTNNSITFNGSGALTFSTLSVTGSNAAVTLSSTGNIALNVAASTIPTLSVTSTGGSVSDAGATGAITSTKATVNAATSISLGQTQPDAISTAVLQGGASGVALSDSVPVTIGGGTATTGNTSITDSYGTAGTAVTFGATSGDSVTFGGNLTVAATGGAAENITTTANALNISGSVSLSSVSGNITLGTANASGSYGQVNLSNSGGTDSVTENATTNLGNVTTGTLTVTSGGSIVNTSGTVAVGGLTLTAGTTSAPGSIQLGTGNAGAATNASISGTIQINEAGNVTLINNDPTVINSGTSGASSNFGVLAATVGNTTTPASDALTVTFASTKGGGFTGLQFNMAGSTGNVGFGITGNADPAAVTLSNDSDTSTTTVGVTDAAGITLGSGISLNGTGATTLTETGTSGTIQDTANSPVFIFGAVTFSSAGGINIANNTANSLGAVTLMQTNASGTSNIAYSEGGTVNLAGISIANTKSTETVSITSTGGNIVESGALNLGNNPALGGVSFSAPTGNITLNTQTNTIGNTGTNVSVPISFTAGATGAGNGVLFTDVNNIDLGNITDASLLTLTESTVSGTISQASGTSIWEYGAATITTPKGAVTLANAGNNFGTLSIDTTNGGAQTAGANVSIQETGDDNYALLNTGTAGNWTATDTTSGITEATGATITVGGVTTLNAPVGPITLTSATNSFGGTNGIKLTTGGNASVTGDNAAGMTLLDGSSIGGNLVLDATGAGGISDSGPSATITVLGNTQLLAPNGPITMLGNNSNYAGTVLLKTGNFTSTFTDNNSVNLLGGSLVNGAMTINSGGNITTSGGLISIFASTLRLNADGSIVISTPIDVDGQLTVDAAAGPTNLSAESISQNLNGITPINAGNTSNYTGASP